MELELPLKIIIWDVEITAWGGSHDRDWDGEGESKEIIQIGAIKVDTLTLAELDSFDVFVKPTKNPILSDYIKEFTGITQTDIDATGIDAKIAVTEFFRWAEDLPLYSWGRLDREALEETAEINNIDIANVVGNIHTIRPIFIERGIPADNYMSSTILEVFGKKTVRRGHNGLNDARTILDALRELTKRHP